MILALSYRWSSNRPRSVWVGRRHSWKSPSHITYLNAEPWCDNNLFWTRASISGDTSAWKRDSDQAARQTPKRNIQVRNWNIQPRNWSAYFGWLVAGGLGSDFGNCFSLLLTVFFQNWHLDGVRHSLKVGGFTLNYLQYIAAYSVLLKWQFLVRQCCW